MCINFDTFQHLAPLFLSTQFMAKWTDLSELICLEQKNSFAASWPKLMARKAVKAVRWFRTLDWIIDFNIEDDMLAATYFISASPFFPSLDVAPSRHFPMPLFVR